MNCLEVMNGAVVEADALGLLENLGTTETTVVDIDVVAAVLVLAGMLDDLSVNTMGSNLLGGATAPKVTDISSN